MPAGMAHTDEPGTRRSGEVERLHRGSAHRRHHERHAGVGRECDQLLSVRLRALTGQRVLDVLECAAALLADDPHQLVDLAPRRQSRRDRPVVGGLVLHGPRRREPGRSGVETLTELRGHRAHVVVVGLVLERALAHHVRAERRVSEQRRVVHALGESVDRVEELRVGGPAPVDALGERDPGDVLGSLEVAHHQHRLFGGRRCKREAAVAHHRGGHAVPARVRARRVPEDLRVEVGVDVDEPRRDHEAVGVDVDRAP